MTKPSSPPEVKTPSWFDSLLIAGVIVATFIFIGLVVSTVWYSVTPKIYESSATVLIEPPSPPTPPTNLSPFDFTYRHEELIAEDNNITKALIKYDLQELPTLRDLSPDDQIRHIQSNLEAQGARQTDDVYHVRFRSHNAKVAQTVLATLLSAYEKHLDARYDSPHSTHELLLKMKARFVKDLFEQTEKVKEVEKQMAAGQIDEDTQALLKKLQKELDLSQRKVDEASKQYAELPEEKEPEVFNFETLSPAERGVVVKPLSVFLLAGGGIGALIGFMVSGLMIAVQSTRR